MPKENLNECGRRVTPKPDDLIEALGATEEEVQVFNMLEIFTVRQLVEFTSFKKVTILLDKKRLEYFIEKAHEVVANPVAVSSKKEKIDERTVWGYIYMSLAMYELMCDGYKSPYVLFNEYMALPSEERYFHLWKQVYFSFKTEAEKWLGVKEGYLTDADVFSYLIWKNALSIGQLDVTAGARVMPFFWNMMPNDVHAKCIENDITLSANVNIPFIAERNLYAIAIDLTSLCNKHEAQLFIKEEKGCPWKPTTLEEVEISKFVNWRNCDFTNILDSMAHGCIILPTGIIPPSCIVQCQRKEDSDEQRPLMNAREYYDEQRPLMDVRDGSYKQRPLMDVRDGSYKQRPLMDVLGNLPPQAILGSQMVILSAIFLACTFLLVNIPF